MAPASVDSICTFICASVMLLSSASTRWSTVLLVSNQGCCCRRRRPGRLAAPAAPADDPAALSRARAIEAQHEIVRRGVAKEGGAGAGGKLASPRHRLPSWSAPTALLMIRVDSRHIVRAQARRPLVAMADLCSRTAAKAS